MTQLHPTLRRMLKRRGLSEGDAPGVEQWVDFLDGFSRYCDDLDADRYTIERAFTISSKEMQDLYERLKQSSEHEIARQRDALEESLAILRAALDTMLDGVLVIDPRREHLGHNRRFLEIWAMPPELVEPGRDAERLQHVGRMLRDPSLCDPPGLQRAIGAVATRDELQLVDGRVIDRFVAPIVGPSGNPFGHLVIFRDVTEERTSQEAIERQEESLRAALALAETASRAKSEFLSNMSHEMRTPLNAIVGFGRLLADDESGITDPEHREFVGYIEKAGEHMLSLVDDLLDLRRIEEGRGSLELELHEVGPLVSAAVSMVRPLIEERRHRLHLAVPGGRLRCDARALVQVLTNLLSNAAKFTPPGGRVELRADLGSDLARFEVVDSGVGIAPAHQSKLFTYYTQVGAKHQLGMRGSGVGLALTRSLVEAMGGSIDVTSLPGAGSTFRVRLPGPVAAGGG